MFERVTGWPWSGKGLCWATEIGFPVPVERGNETDDSVTDGLNKKRPQELGCKTGKEE